MTEVEQLKAQIIELKRLPTLEYIKTARQDREISRKRGVRYELKALGARILRLNTVIAWYKRKCSRQHQVIKDLKSQETALEAALDRASKAVFDWDSEEGSFTSWETWKYYFMDEEFHRNIKRQAKNE